MLVICSSMADDNITWPIENNRQLSKNLMTSLETSAREKYGSRSEGDGRGRRGKVLQNRRSAFDEGFSQKKCSSHWVSSFPQREESGFLPIMTPGRCLWKRTMQLRRKIMSLLFYDLVTIQIEVYLRFIQKTSPRINSVLCSKRNVIVKIVVNTRRLVFKLNTASPLKITLVFFQNL